MKNKYPNRGETQVKHLLSSILCVFSTLKWKTLTKYRNCNNKIIPRKSHAHRYPVCFDLKREQRMLSFYVNNKGKTCMAVKSLPVFEVQFV